MKIVSVFITLLLIAGYAMSEDIIELPEGMVQIPVGVFERSFYDSDKNKSRTYKVYVDAFYMDKYEVTNAQFAEFLNAVEYKSPTYFIVDEDKAWVDLCRNQGAVANIHYVDSEGQVRPDEPEHLGGYRYSLEEYRLPADYTGGKYVADPVYENQPVIAVTWYGAMAYAEWAGKRLPTDAEWERAKSTSFLGTKHLVFQSSFKDQSMLCMP